MKYEVILPFRNYRKGQIVDDSDRYIRRKLREGGCLKPVSEKAEKSAPKNKAVESAPENKSGGN